MRALALVLGLVMGANAASGAEQITKLKDLHRRTALVQGGQPRAVIVAPPAKGYADIATRVRDKIKELARVELPIKSPAEVNDDLLKQFNILLIGNAQDNDFVRRLVWERWIFDTWYPGDERFVVRSIHNPFGHGKNIIFIGGENPKTVRAAAEKFLGMLKPGDPLSIGWVMTFETDKRGGSLSEKTIKRYTERADKALGFKNGRNLISSAASMAKRYYSTGQEGWAKLFKIYMQKHKAIGAPGMGTHMNVYDTVSQWELIEESPAFSDEDRLFITNHFLYILRSKEGCFKSFFRKGIQTPGVRHNHQTLPGLACLFGGRYFKLGYHLPEADEWIQAGKKLFDSQKLSHKPQCDCNCYEWGTLYQTGWWSLGSGDYTFFENGSMRTAADRALLEMDNRGYSSCNGDFWSLYYFPTMLFQQAATFYRDGRYEWAIRKRYADSSPERHGVANMVRGVEPKEPTDLLGVKAAPMSPDFYNAKKTTMPSEPERNIPIEISFDKMSFRRTFNAEDQYLLIDGIGAGSHGHVDVNGVSQFTDNSRVWLMDCSYTEAPNMRDHNVVTILRNGVTVDPPPLAALDPATGIADLETFGFTKTSLPKYCGMDWQRHIFWAKERYFLFIDELVAREPGDYSLRSHWRTPGAGTLDGMTFTLRQQAKPPKEGVRQITRKDAEGDGKCMKIIHADGALGKKVQLTKGKWSVTVVGCGHDTGDDSFYLHLDGKRVATIPVSPEKVSPSGPAEIDVAADGEHELKLTLRERPGTICDKVILKGPGGREIVIDALDLDIIKPPPGRIDTFTLQCLGAEKASLTLDTENVGKWFKQYEYTDPIASILQFSASREMKPGDRHCFANVFFVSNPEAPVQIEMRPLADGVVLIKDGDRLACLGIGPAAFKLGDAEVAAKAGQFMLAADRFAVRQATSINWRGALLASEQPTSVEKTVTENQAARAADLQKAWTAAGKAPVAAARPKAETKGIDTLWSADVGSPVLALAQGDVNGDGKAETAIGCEDKKVRLLNSSGKIMWEFEAGGKINSVAIADIDGDGKGEVIAGSDDRCCYVLNADGKERWRFQGEEGDDPYWRRYWKAGEVEKVLAADINGNGKKEIIFAAANMNIHACDVTGKRLWRFRRYGVCTSLVAADLTGDGKMEVIGGPAKITCTSACSVIGQDGKAIASYGNDGWASALTAVCTADLDGDGKLEVICGTNMNNIFALNMAKGKLALRWKYTAGDVINSLCGARLTDGKAQHVIAGSASEYVYCLDAAGKVAWTANLHDPVLWVAARDLNGDGRDEIVAATAHALFVLDAGGKPVATFASEDTILCVDLGTQLLIGTQGGAVQSLKLKQ
ncbi:MAG: hypothetical protein GXP25_03800 [Planctomycetes bacterium]|nr:hypothetical protein [Planctomycetota bacterium]